MNCTKLKLRIGLLERDQCHNCRINAYYGENYECLIGMYHRSISTCETEEQIRHFILGHIDSRFKDSMNTIKFVTITINEFFPQHKETLIKYLMLK